MIEDIMPQIINLGIDFTPGDPDSWYPDNTPEIEPYETAESLPQDTYNYLKSRGDKYGIPVQEMLDKVPDVLKHHPKLIEVFVQSKDISHFQSIANGGSLCDPNNWDYEDEGLNSSRQAKNATESEIAAMAVDSQFDAHILMDLVTNNSLTLDDLMEHQEYVEETFEKWNPQMSGADIAKLSTKMLLGVAA